MNTLRFELPCQVWRAHNVFISTDNMCSASDECSFQHHVIVFIATEAQVASDFYGLGQVKKVLGELFCAAPR